jgi:hypothetical protein
MTTPQRAGRDDDCLEARRLRRKLNAKGCVCNGREHANHRCGPKYSGPDGQVETGSSPLIAGSSPQRRGSRDKSESAATGEREAAELGRLEGRLMAEYGASLGTDAVFVVSLTPSATSTKRRYAPM